MSINLLIVDDEKIYRSGLRQLLEKEFENIKVIEAENGLEALDILKEGNADAMLLDINMPKMDGLELLETVKEENLKKIPTIIVSGYDDFEYARRALRNEVSDYLLKPLTPAEARTTVGRLIEKVIIERGGSGDYAEDGLAGVLPAGIRENIIINGIVSFIEKNYKTEISMENMSAELKYNGNYLSQYFRTKTGTKLNDYIRLFRVEKAKKCLRDPSFRINDVAKEVGISNPQYFSTVFKKETGYTPQEYREISNKI